MQQTLPARRSTLRDVARVAGVSVSTASMALRDNPRIADGTRRAVRRAADKLNYVPDSLGQSLRAQSARSVALVIPHAGEQIWSHPYYLSLLQGVLDRCNSGDLSLLLSTAPTESEEAKAYRRILLGRAADGIIVTSAALSDRNVLTVAASGYPTVFIGRFPGHVALETVGVDDQLGGRLATDHLIDAHRRTRIALLAGPLDGLAAVDRLDGYRTSLARHGLAFDEALVREGNHDQASGTALCGELLRAGVAFDAVFASNDEMAVGALRALAAAGRRVPDDVSVVGFDDSLIAPVVTPALSTVRQPVRDLGWLATSRLIERMADPARPVEQVQMPVELVVRRSCGCGG